jgi:hypothetical protein
MSNLIINLLLFVFIVSVYRRFPFLSGHAQISQWHSPRPPIPCLSTTLRPLALSSHPSLSGPPPSVHRPLSQPRRHPPCRRPALAPLSPMPSSLSPPPGVRGGPSCRGVRARASSIRGSRAVVAQGCREGGGGSEGSPSLQGFFLRPFLSLVLVADHLLF